MDSLPTTPIELTVPGDGRYLRLARLVAGGVATTYGLPLSELEDLCVAVNEMCLTLVEAGGGEPIHLTFGTRNGTLLVRGATRDADRTDIDETRLGLSHQILDVLAESHCLSRADGQAEFTMVTRLRGAGVG